MDIALKFILVVYQIVQPVLQMSPQSSSICFVNMSVINGNIFDGRYWHDPCNTKCCDDKSTFIDIKITEEEKQRMCLFNIDNNFNTCCEFTGSCPVTGSVGECVVQQREICDGKSECLTDECGCTDIVTNRSTGNMSHDVHRQITARRTGVFWCADGSGCIAFANLCDGHRRICYAL